MLASNALACCEQPAVSAPTWSATIKPATGYGFGDQGITISRKSVSQGTIFASWQDGWYAGGFVSTSLPLRSLSKSEGSEIDAIAGWSGSCVGYVCTLEAAWYFEPTIGSFKHDLARFRVEVKKEYATNGWSGGWYVGNDYYLLLGTADTSVVRTGFFGTTPHWGPASASVRIGYGYDIAPGHSTFNWEGGLDWAMSDQWSVSIPHVEQFVPLDSRPGQTILSATISWHS